MSVEELKAGISELPESEFRLLRDWLAELDATQWDAQIKRDSDSGALDFLKREALDESAARSPVDL